MGIGTATVSGDNVALCVSYAYLVKVVIVGYVLYRNWKSRRLCVSYCDADPGHIPSLRARLSRTQVEFIDGMIPRRFVDRSDGIRRLIEIGIRHFPDDVPPAGSEAA